MTAVALSVLWTITFTGIVLAALSVGVRATIHHRHNRLLTAWADQYNTNSDDALRGHMAPPIELEDFPGMRETWADVRAFGRFSSILMTVTGSAAILLVILLTCPIG